MTVRAVQQIAPACQKQFERAQGEGADRLGGPAGLLGDIGVEFAPVYATAGAACFWGCLKSSCSITVSNSASARKGRLFASSSGVMLVSGFINSVIAKRAVSRPTLAVFGC